MREAQLPIPSEILKPATMRVMVTVLILPDSSSKRMLEDLCLRAFEKDIVKICADQYIECVQNSDFPLRAKNVPKATLKAFLACKEDETKHEVRLWLGEAIRESWWPWDHSAFDEVKEFLKQIASVS